LPRATVGLTVSLCSSSQVASLKKLGSVSGRLGGGYKEEARAAYFELRKRADDTVAAPRRPPRRADM